MNGGVYVRKNSILLPETLLYQTVLMCSLCLLQFPYKKIGTDTPILECQLWVAVCKIGQCLHSQFAKIISTTILLTPLQLPVLWTVLALVLIDRTETGYILTNVILTVILWLQDIILIIFMYLFESISGFHHSQSSLFNPGCPWIFPCILNHHPQKDFHHFGFFLLWRKFLPGESPVSHLELQPFRQIK